MQNAAPAVQQAYTNAANADAGYAKGLGSGVQSTLDSTQNANNAFLSQMGTPSSALKAAPSVGDVAYGLQGYIPASTLQQEGAGWESAAQLAPGNLLAAGQQQAAGMMNPANDPTMKTLNEDLAKLAATQPEVYQKLLTAYNTQLYHQQQLGLSADRVKLQAQRDQILANQGQQRINIEATRAAQTALNQNRSYRIQLQRLGISQKNLQLRALAQEAKKQGGGYTPDELVHIKGKAGSIAYSAFNGVPATSTKPAKPPLNYKQAMKLEILNGIPPSIAAEELANAGYKPPKNLSSPASYPGAPGMFAGLGQLLAGGLSGVGKKGGKANYGVSQGIAGGVGQTVGGAYAHGHNAGGFLPPGLGFEYNRHDQGRDIQTKPGAPIIAPGDGYVVRIASDPGGGGGHFGPAYPIVHFVTGPYAGQDVYIGHTRTAVHPGQHFRAGDVLSHTQISGPWNGGAPSGWAEIGFAPGGTPGAFDQPAPF